MSSSRANIESIFLSALERSTAAERSAYLDRACGGDTDLRERVEALLRAHVDAASFLQKPLVELAAAGQPPRVVQSIDPSPWSAGKKIAGSYEVLRPLGTGGMGTVYLAYDNATQRRVAVKVPMGEFMDNAVLRRNITQEAKALVKLVHPHIVHAFDVRDDQTTDYRPAIFMEYCEGGSVLDRIGEKGRLTLTDVLDIAIQIGWALEYAHKRGYVHRDVKPGNVLLTLDQKALLADFGLARRLLYEGPGSRGRDSASDECSRSLIGTRTIMGTPEYMAPEQWDGIADAQSDVYSFGTMLYELSCGERPFSASDWKELRRLHTTVAPPHPRQLNKQIPDRLNQLVLACLTKEPARRPIGFSNVIEELRASYKQIAGGHPHEHRRSAPSSKDIGDRERCATAWALVRVGNGCCRRGDLSDAEQSCQEALDTFSTLSNVEGVRAGRLNLGCVLVSRGQLDEAATLFENVERACREAMDQEGCGAALKELAEIAERRGEIDKAISLLQQANDLFSGLPNLASRRAFLLAFAGILVRHGEYDRAMSLYRKAERMAHETRCKETVEACLHNQGLLHEYQGRLDESIRMHQEAEKLSRDIGSREGLAKSLFAQGQVREKLGEVARALDLYREAEEVCRALDDEQGIQASLVSQAMIMVNHGQADEAEELLKRAEQICRNLALPGPLARALANRAIVLARHLGKARMAAPLAEEAYSLVVDRNLGTLEGNVKEVLDDVRSLAGVPEEQECRSRLDGSPRDSVLSPQARDFLRDLIDEQIVNSRESLCPLAKNLLSPDPDVANESVNRVFAMAQARDKESLVVLEQAIQFRYGRTQCSFYEPQIRTGSRAELHSDRVKAKQMLLTIASEEGFLSTSPHEIQRLLARSAPDWEDLLTEIELVGGREQAQALVLLATHLQIRKLLGEV